MISQRVPKKGHPTVAMDFLVFIVFHEFSLFFTVYHWFFSSLLHLMSGDSILWSFLGLYCSPLKVFFFFSGDVMVLNGQNPLATWYCEYILCSFQSLHNYPTWLIGSNGWHQTLWPFAAKHIMISRFLRKMYPKWSTTSSWWFHKMFIFTPTWEKDPFWRIFSKWVGSTTNQSNFPMPSSRQHEDGGPNASSMAFGVEIHLGFGLRI